MWTTNTPLTRSLRDQGTEQLINIAPTWPGILNLLLAYCLPKFQPKHQVTFVLWPWHQLWHHRRHDLRFPIQTRTLRKWCVLWRRISNIFFACFPPLWFLRNDYAYFRTRSIQAEFPQILGRKSNGTSYCLTPIRPKYQKDLRLSSKIVNTTISIIDTRKVTSFLTISSLALLSRVLPLKAT